MSAPPTPPPIPHVQTPHLKSKSTRVVNTTSQLISSHYPSSHPCRSSNSSPPSVKMPPVWRGGAEKALESAACRRCGGGGREGSTANQPQKRCYGEARRLISRVPGSIARRLEVWEWVLRSRIFDLWSSS